MSRIPDDVQVAASKAQVVSIRNKSVAAGQFFQVVEFLASNGIRKVNATFGGADTFTNQIYLAHKGTDDVIMATTAPSATSKASGTTSSEVFSGKCAVFFNNTDTVAHAVNFDAVGWPN